MGRTPPHDFHDNDHSCHNHDYDYDYNRARGDDYDDCSYDHHRACRHHYQACDHDDCPPDYYDYGHNRAHDDYDGAGRRIDGGCECRARAGVNV